MDISNLWRNNNIIVGRNEEGTFSFIYFEECMNVGGTELLVW